MADEIGDSFCVLCGDPLLSDMDLDTGLCAACAAAAVADEQAEDDSIRLRAVSCGHRAAWQEVSELDCMALAIEVRTKARMLEERANEISKNAPKSTGNFDPDMDAQVEKAHALITAAKVLRKAVGVLGNIVIDEPA